MQKQNSNPGNAYYFLYAVFTLCNIAFSLLSPNQLLHGFGNDAIFCVPLSYLFMRTQATKLLHLKNSTAGMESEMIILCPPVTVSHGNKDTVAGPARMIQCFSAFCFFGNLIGISHSYYHGTNFFVRILFACALWFILMLTGYMAGAREAYNIKKMNN